MILLIGGTGTLGHATAQNLLKRDLLTDITVFSRDELKQKQMAESLPKGHRVKFIIGDVRDEKAVSRAVKGMDTVFLFAALKHIELGEIHVEEFIKTDVLGTLNVAHACMDHGVHRMIFSSTDKAVDPINAYGNCKALSERLLMSFNEKNVNTLFYVFRWGNVIGSRGSVIHAFAKTLMSEQKAYVTHHDMTRFWIPIEDAVDFMLSPGSHMEVQIPKLKSARITTLVNVIAKVLGVKDYKIQYTGMRKGEKIHEAISSRHHGDITSENSKALSEDELIQMVTSVLSKDYAVVKRKRAKLFALPEMVT